MNYKERMKQMEIELEIRRSVYCEIVRSMFDSKDYEETQTLDGAGSMIVRMQGVPSTQMHRPTVLRDTSRSNDAKVSFAFTTVTAVTTVRSYSVTGYHCGL